MEAAPKLRFVGFWMRRFGRRRKWGWGRELHAIAKKYGGFDLEIKRDKHAGEIPDVRMIVLDTNVVSEPSKPALRSGRDGLVRSTGVRDALS